MNLPLATIEKIKLWNDVRFDKLNQIDAVPFETAQQENNAQAEYARLQRAHSNAVKRLHGEKYDRY